MTEESIYPQGPYKQSKAIRASRDGDQFHYIWAARRCLRLLSPANDLVAISIEGPSIREIKPGESLEAGVDQIDVAEYYGSEDLKNATLVRYIQLKHSTLNPGLPWSLSGLEKTIRAFSERYRQIESQFEDGDFTTNVEFCFITNRPISNNLTETVVDAASGVTSRHPNILMKLQHHTGLDGKRLSAFCRLLKLDGMHEDYWLQRASLVQETYGYLPGDDINGPVQLKELVTKKSLSESAENPSITKIDVLRVLGTEEDRLFPAFSLISSAEESIRRTQESDLAGAILNANAPVVVHAEGGVGKSVLSQRIKTHLPEDSACVVYDCFGNGDYRRPSSLRHRHRGALVQIANELSSLRLCDPLIPSSMADEADYLRAFVHRLRQCIGVLKAKNGQSILCIVIDAADSAEMAAREQGGDHSFARDLLREQLPDDIRLVLLCRTERQELLDPPPSVLRLELKPFTREETATFLRRRFPDSSIHDVDEFHRLTSHNPRVQATALAQFDTLSDVLTSLGPNPTTVDDTISVLLQGSIEKLRDSVPGVEREQIDAICAALSVLRPLVPIDVLSSASGVKAAAIRSLVSDLGNPLLLRGNTVQFRDEPVETWFRTRFKPNQRQLDEFIEKLYPLASKSTFVASTLPQLMLEAGKLSELIELALSSVQLPTNPIEKRDVELHRLQFALKAGLRTNRFSDAAKLALKAAQETAGDTRQLQLLQANTDLVAEVMDPDGIQEIVSRCTFRSDWTGSRHAYEAGLLSCIAEFQSEARSRLRMAYDWLMNWSRLSKDERVNEPVQDEDIAALALAVLNVDGPERCASELNGWKPKRVAFRVGRIVASRLVDHGRYSDLDHLSIAAKKNLYLFLAINLELRLVHRTPPKKAVKMVLDQIQNRDLEIGDSYLDNDKMGIDAITSLVESAHLHRLRSRDFLASLLKRHLPDTPPLNWYNRYICQRIPLLRAYSLSAGLHGTDLSLVELADSRVREQLANDDSTSDSTEVRKFKGQIGALLPWYKLWAETFLNQDDQSGLTKKLIQTGEASKRAKRALYREDTHISGEIAEVWFDILIGQKDAVDSHLREFKSWIEELERPFFTPTWTRLARLAARTTKCTNDAYWLVQQAFRLIKDEREDAESKAQVYVELARAILAVDKAEAKEYFNQAIEVSSKIGDEIHNRWSAILHLAERAASPSSQHPKTAYKLARCSELTSKYLDDHLDWEGTVEALAGLCPSSCFAILSRWRDRGFGQPSSQIGTAVNYLMKLGLIDPRTVAALAPLRTGWDYSDLLKKILQQCDSRSDREKVVSHLMHYMRWEIHSSDEWEKIKETTGKYSLSVPDVNQLIEHTVRRQSALGSHDPSLWNRPEMEDQDFMGDWNGIFANLDLHTSTDLTCAYNRFMCNAQRMDREAFFRELFFRVPIGKEAEFVRVFSESAEFHLYDIRHFLEQFPSEWKSRLAVRTSLQEGLKRICSRHCLEIGKHRYFEPFPFQLASDVSDATVPELIRPAVASIGKKTEFVSAGHLFTLIGLLTFFLSHDEALDVLQFGLGLFDDALDDDDGDGSWTEALCPPSEVYKATAGYIWAALAAPQATVRWEAAHVVVGLCRLDSKSVVAHLVGFATQESGGPFADARLHFYHLHARQWLMIGLARAASENPGNVVPHVDFLIRFALSDEPHVIIRHFAARAVIALAEAGKVNLEEKIATDLAAVNISQLPVERSQRYRRTQNLGDSETRTERFSFGHDMRQYWFERLGDCFAKNALQIENEAEKVICDDWRLTENGHWERDERRRRRIFRDDATHHSHGAYPRNDDLNFYLSYHAMMTVAGKFLATTPLHQDPDYDEDEFNSWLEMHLLSRQDGYWLADRKDPIPCDCSSWKNVDKEDHWRWSVQRPDFDRLLGLGGQRLNLWGNWNTVVGQREERVGITSALVVPSRSGSLLRALQTADNPFHFRLPQVGDELEIDESDFRLQGWVEDRNTESGLDRFDPWAGDLEYPALRPGKSVVDSFGLSTDKESRVWYTESEGTTSEVLWSQVWSSRRHSNGNGEGENGRRLQASYSFVQELLGRVNMDLIVEVQIDRSVRREHYKRDRNDEIEHVYPYFRIFILKADGRTWSV